MELQKAKILLEKINSLYKSIHMDNGTMASIERDLMLSYIRQLYEVFREEEEKAASPEPARSSRKGRTENPPAEKPKEKHPQPEPIQRTYKPPRIIEIPDSIKEMASDSPPPAPQTKSTESEKTVPSPTSKTTATPSAEPAPATEAQKKVLNLLLEQKRATELSEKLSESPIRDLNKSLAINDRLLYMNELFGKEMSALENALHRLNQFDSLDEAKGLLGNLALKYDWTEEEKLETAKSFVKMVRRRYL